MSEEKEYQIGFWVDGLISPSGKLVFNDHLIIEGVPSRAQSKVFFKIKERKVNNNSYENEKKKTLAEILQIYGLVSSIYVETPSGYCTGPITRDAPFGEMDFIFCTIEDKPSEESKQRYKPLIEKAVTKYYSIKDIYENKSKAFLRNAIDYYNRSLKDDRLEEKLIDLMISLESLFSGNERELSYRVSLRTSFFLGANQESERPEIFNKVYDLYDKRSAVVHGTENVKLDWSEIIWLQQQLCEAIKRFIHIELQPKMLADLKGKGMKQKFLCLLDEAVYNEEKRKTLNTLVEDAIRRW